MAFEGLTAKLNAAFKKLRGKGRLSESDIKEAMREIRRQPCRCRSPPLSRLRFSVSVQFPAPVSAMRIGQRLPIKENVSYFNL